MVHYYIGIDVGTGSVRAGLVDEAGHVVKVAVHDINRVSPTGGQYLQSSQNIWSAVCHTVKEVLKGSKVAAENVKGIGFRQVRMTEHQSQWMQVMNRLDR